jgi:hypothetical protein
MPTQASRSPRKWWRIIRENREASSFEHNAMVRGVFDGRARGPYVAMDRAKGERMVRQAAVAYWEQLHSALGDQ